MNLSLCIWCLKPSSDTAVEHVFPEAIGGTMNCVLPGHVVCERCNNRMAPLVRAVADEFDVTAFFAEVRRKKGRPPFIGNRGNFAGVVTPSGPALFLNLDPVSVSMPGYGPIAAFRGKARDVQATVRRTGAINEVTAEVQFGQGKKFIRGITKIAFNSLAFMCGADEARASRYNEIREFVRHGGMGRHIIIGVAEDEQYVLKPGPFWRSQGGDGCMQLRIASVTFFVDLSEGEKMLPTLIEAVHEQHGPDGWTCLPA